MAFPSLGTLPSRVTRRSTFSADWEAWLAKMPAWGAYADVLAAAMGAISAGTAVGIPYTFSTTTADADPGAGYLRLDNATQNTATTIRADLLGSDGSTWTDVLATFDDSDSTVKGHILLQKLADATKWILFTVSSLASPSGYKNITVTVVSASAANPFTNGDALVLKFTRTGDKGAAGAAGTIAITNVTTATTATTLTSTPTVLQITPASYGVAVTLPNATTCDVGSPVHVIANKGAYPVRVLNNSGTLLGFVMEQTTSDVSLIDNSSAAGIWAFSNFSLVGCSASTLTTYFDRVINSIDLGTSREILIGHDSATSYLYAMVYDASTNTFGSAVAVRSEAGVNDTNVTSCLVSTDKVMVVSFNATTGMEAVILSVTGTSVAVGTPATATISANFAALSFPSTNGRGGLIAVGSSFVVSYRVATPQNQIRALTVSGTTVTIGNATALSGSESYAATMRASGSIVVLACCTATEGYITPYTISGTTITKGTEATVATGGYYLSYYLVPGATDRWFFVFRDDGDYHLWGGIATLSGTTITTSIAELSGTNASPLDAMLLPSGLKLLVLNSGTSNNCNILTDDGAGAASVGTPITLSSGTSGRCCIYTTGTDVFVQDNDGTYYKFYRIDCSGASPVNADTLTSSLTPSSVAGFSASSSYMKMHSGAVYTTEFAQTHGLSSTIAFQSRIQKGHYSAIPIKSYAFPGGNPDPGKTDAEVWLYSLTALSKVECAPQ